MTKLALAAVIALIGCGDNTKPATPPPDAATTCGDLRVEGDEQCDDGNVLADDGCSPACQLECGDGVLGTLESCDPAIPTGTAGACPTDATCVDTDPCTIAVVSGTGCDVTCELATITGAMDGDGCCPVGANATDDDDCEPVCGN